MWGFGYRPPDVETLWVTGDWSDGVRTEFSEKWRAVYARVDDCIIFTLLSNLCIFGATSADWDDPTTSRPAETDLLVWRHAAWKGFAGLWLDYGDIYMNRERSILSLPAYLDGQVRLTLIHIPQIPQRKERLKMRGAVLTFGVPKGFWQPTAACVYIEGPIEAKHANLKDMSTTIRCGDDGNTPMSHVLCLRC